MSDQCSRGIGASVGLSKYVTFTWLFPEPLLIAAKYPKNNCVQLRTLATLSATAAGAEPGNPLRRAARVDECSEERELGEKWLRWA